MEIVIIEDLVASYRTGWVRIAKTSDSESLRIGDVLRRRGNGQGSEELKVEAISEGRVLLLRGHGPTPVDVHFHGSVFTVLDTARVAAHVVAIPTDQALAAQTLADRRRANLAIARQRKAEKRQGAAV